MNKAFKTVMVVLALALVAALMLGAGATHPALAGCSVVPLPKTCADVSSFCADPCGGGLYFDTPAQCTSTLEGELCGGGSACGNDGRTNTNCSAPEILYCSDGMANFYKFVEGEGIAHFSINLSELQQSVEVNTLIMQVGDVRVYLLPDGTAELLAPQPDGKTYFMVFDPSNCTSIKEGAEFGL